MNKYLKVDDWRIIEEGFDPKNHRSSESIFSLGNGRMGQRANFEEKYSGNTLQGTYIGGVYYTDKTRVGWWKNGYPEYFAKVLNAPYWNGIYVEINNEQLDLGVCKVRDFTRILNMKEGYLERSFIAIMPNGNEVKVNARRFISMANKEIAAIRYALTPLNFSGDILFTSSIDGDIKNEDANYNEKFWDVLETDALNGEAYLRSQTKKTNFQVGVGIKYAITLGGNEYPVLEDETIIDQNYVANKVSVFVEKGKQVCFYKYIAVLSSMNHNVSDLLPNAKILVNDACSKGFDTLLEEHRLVWKEIWEHSDIVIEGDVEAQQGIRFNIFQLKQTYTGDDARLNIGPKGFTGEKYGGSTYWDTEAYCVPFYLSTADAKVTRNLLIYRYKQLDKAIENGQKLGFTDGAALYPMVTMNGEECHNEWEITFEEIHRNGAIAYAIYRYINYTGDDFYLEEYGLEVLTAIARFWAQRATFSEARKKYVILGVTGPNEYENNVNNNWYTNKIAIWCMKYAIECLEKVKSRSTDRFLELVTKMKLDYKAETRKWQEIIDQMYFPEEKELGIFLQQDGYMDKEQILAADLNPEIRPLNQHWSWDRILRSCFIKQADVLQGIYFFEKEYDDACIKRNFDFYESRTVHESSLSPCVHSILAARIGDMTKAYNLYLRTARLDLDDYNKEAHEGLHITSMAGTWMSIVEGFGGMRIKEGILSFQPAIPESWKSYSFKVMYRKNILNVRVQHGKVIIFNEEGGVMELAVYGKKYKIVENSKIEI